VRAAAIAATATLALLSAAAYAAPAGAARGTAVSQAPVGYAAAAAAAAAVAARHATVTRSAHVAFEGCNAQHIILSATAPTHPFTPNKPVTIKVRLSNTGSTTCGGPLAQHLPQARQKLTVGPCGTIPLVVRNRRGGDVYPGPATFHCPEETGFQLGPNSTAKATASWSQVSYLGSESSPALEQASPGTYRLLVDGAVTVPVTLTPG
jgi:hypothetical protein